MARQLRLEYDGALYHVTTRGNARFHKKCLGPDLASTHTPRPLPRFLFIQIGSLFSVDSCGEVYGKTRWMPDDYRRA